MKIALAAAVRASKVTASAPVAAGASNVPRIAVA
jgi:hypothetical protein